MPLGDVPIDEKLARAILDSSTNAADDPRAHEFEHSLEVQLPFIQKLRPGFSLVPICLGSLSLGECLTFGSELAEGIKGAGGDVLIVASSDMTHYEPHDTAKEKDMKVVQEIVRLDPEAVYKTVREGRITMCGVIPVTVMITAAKALGAKNAELVNYMTSGETSGDYKSVVGYAGVIVW